MFQLSSGNTFMIKVYEHFVHFYFGVYITIIVSSDGRYLIENGIDRMCGKILICVTQLMRDAIRANKCRRPDDCCIVYGTKSRGVVRLWLQCRAYLTGELRKKRHSNCGANMQEHR